MGACKSIESNINQTTRYATVDNNHNNTGKDYFVKVNQYLQKIGEI